MNRHGRVLLDSGRVVVWMIVLLGVAGASRAAPPGSPLRVQTSSSKGIPAFVTAADGGPIPVDPAPGRAHAEPIDFLFQYGHLFGIADPIQELILAKAETDALGHTHTTFDQFHQGVPVFSGVLKVHQGSAGEVLVANGHFYSITPKLNTVPALTASEAEGIAAEALAGRGEGHGTGILPVKTRAGSPCHVERCELVIVDPGWYGDPPVGPHLAYHIIMEAAAAGIREAFFVDAQSGEVLDRWSMIYHAIDRSIHDGAGTNGLPGPLARGEGGPPAQDADVNAAYDYVGDTYDYFDRAFGRDGVDGMGGPIVVTVNSMITGCPNAGYSFNLFQSAFCTGVVSDDIVAHELTHGITQHSANLIYQNQSGQLNESFSDVFGELVDLFNGDAAFVDTVGVPPLWPTHPTGPGQDAPNNRRVSCSPGPGHPGGVRWMMGEDADAFADALRDMWDPLCYSDPDYANSHLQTCSLSDNGGVHSGSGVPNHAFAMLTDGKTFNGVAVSGIGPIKAGAVWYRALTVYLTVASDFEDAYFAFKQSAADLVGTFPNDPRTGLPSDSMFTAADAAEVDKALVAVEMNGAGACGASVPVLDSAPALQCASPEIIFADDFEAGTNGWMVANSSPPTAYDWELSTEPLPFGRAGVAWFCEDRNIGGCGNNNPPEDGLHYLYSPLIQLPGAINLPVLAFDHFVELEPRWDGGDVRISVNFGPWQTVPIAAFHHNPYNWTLFTAGQYNTNPYAGQVAFTGVGGGWGTSLIDLAPFVAGGDTLQVRFDFSKDQCFGITGWFIDDFAVYHCPASGDCNTNGVPDEVDLARGPYRHRFVSQPRNHNSGNASDMDGGGIAYHAFADNFTLLRPRTISAIKLWGGYRPGSLAPADHFTVIFHAGEGGVPGAVLSSETDVPVVRSRTGDVFMTDQIDEYEFMLTLTRRVSLPPGTYFAEILNDTSGHPDTFIWQRATVGDIPGMAGSTQAPGVAWLYDVLPNMSLELYGPVVGSDCDADALPDECQSIPDCNANSVHDACDACGDHDGSGAADLADYGVLSGCLSGPGASSSPGCACLLDADADADLDLSDFATFQICAAPQ